MPATKLSLWNWKNLTFADNNSPLLYARQYGTNYFSSSETTFWSGYIRYNWRVWSSLVTLYKCGVAVAKPLGKNPREIAEMIAEKSAQGRKILASSVAGQVLSM